MAEILLKCTIEQQQQINEFCDAHKYDRNVTEMTKITFVHRAMYLVDPCPITNREKRVLVEYLYTSVAKCETNDFKLSFEIGNCIEFCWNLSNGKIRIKPKCRLFCCVSVPEEPCVNPGVDHHKPPLPPTPCPDPNPCPPDPCPPDPCPPDPCPPPVEEEKHCCEKKCSECTCEHACK